MVELKAISKEILVVNWESVLLSSQKKMKQTNDQQQEQDQQ